MSNTHTDSPKSPMNRFERYLTLWVALCIAVGIVVGQVWPRVFQALGTLEVARVNLPVGLLIWVMIIPMLIKIDLVLCEKSAITPVALASRCSSIGSSSHFRWHSLAGSS